jgi:hypothetical protein
MKLKGAARRAACPGGPGGPVPPPTPPPPSPESATIVVSVGAARRPWWKGQNCAPELLWRAIRANRNGVNETVKDIREQLKAIKQAVAGIEFRLSQLESVSLAPPSPRSEPKPAKRPPGIEQKSPFKLKVRRSNR